MNFKQIIEITMNRINETDIDEQIDIIVKSAINHSYLHDLSTIEPSISTAYIPAINGLITLPEDFSKIINISPDNIIKKIGNNLLVSKDGIYTIMYEVTPEPLVNDEDTPLISEKLQYLLSTYACYEYFNYRKKIQVANNFLNQYLSEKEKISQTSDNLGSEYVEEVIEI